MRTSPRLKHCRGARHTVGQIVVAILLTAVQTLSATTYMSVEPVPNRDVVGDNNLALIRGIGYNRLEQWSQRLLSECLAVDSVIDALSAHGAITSVTATNTRVLSKDGKTLTITSKGTTADGKPRNDVQVFEKSSST